MCRQSYRKCIFSFSIFIQCYVFWCLYLLKNKKKKAKYLSNMYIYIFGGGLYFKRNSFLLICLKFWWKCVQELANNKQKPREAHSKYWFTLVANGWSLKTNEGRQDPLSSRLFQILNTLHKKLNFFFKRAKPWYPLTAMKYLVYDDLKQMPIKKKGCTVILSKFTFSQ